MRLKEVSYERKLYLVVYLTEQERDNLNSMQEEWNSKYSGVITFVSGDKEIKSVLKQMIKH